jgi:hypothetical protein
MAKRVLSIFDIDDTLFTSESLIIVKKDNKVVHELTPAEFNSYKLKDGESFDYSQFRSGRTFRKNAKPIDKMLNRASSIVRRQSAQSKSIILTARMDFKYKKQFLAKFRDHGFPIDDVFVERSGNLTGKRNHASHVGKGAIMRRYIKLKNWDTIRMWDDHPGNLDILHKLGELHPEVEIQTYLVNPNGDILRYK